MVVVMVVGMVRVGLGLVMMEIGKQRSGVVEES